MTHVPAPLSEGRARSVALVAAIGILQGIAMGIAAFATRDAFAALHQAQSQRPLTLAILVGAGVAVALLRVLARARAESLGQHYAKSLRHRLYDHIAGMSESDLAKRRTGALSLRFVGDLSAARGWVGLGITRLVSAVVVLPGAALVLYLLNPYLALAASLPVAASLLLAFGLAIGLEHYHRRLRSRRARIAINMMERIAQAPDLDLAGRTGKELEVLDENGDRLRQQATARVTRSSLLRAIPQIGAALGGVAILWAAARPDIAAAEAAAALAMLGILMLPLQELAGVWDRYCGWRVAREKCGKLLAQPSTRRLSERQGRPVSVTLDNAKLRALTVNAVLPAGSLTFVSGPNGSGKSSLAAMVAGLSPPEQGHVLYDEGRVALPSVAYVPDRPAMLRGSLRRSLSLGLSPRPSRRKTDRVAQQMGLGGLLSRIGGIDGSLPSGASVISNGEALRIALARAILSRADLIVVDNAQLRADPEGALLLKRLRTKTKATVLVTGPRMTGFTNARTLVLADRRAILSHD
ncbi:ABC transporter ATP-binding protein [Thalassococcus sp. S3]|uniref:ATP-binding cassette domain-containing protein n=1 Tax=Thalassococcus sp. S3 TaxID=2017482 RepID=UPI0013EEBAE8|nr:ABC transporter ATP-binding protein [Thalassococcus sp. S3]